MGIRESFPSAWQTLPELSLIVQMQTAGESLLARQKVLFSDITTLEFFCKRGKCPGSGEVAAGLLGACFSYPPRPCHAS